MGATCQKQFENIPDTSPLYDDEQYQRQQQRMSLNSIKPQHRTVKPDPRKVQIGMLHSKLSKYDMQNNVYSTVNNYQTQYNNDDKNKSMYATNINNQQLLLHNAIVDIDRQRLHATKRPSSNIQTVYIGNRQNTKIYTPQKQIQPLDFNFYYSLGLPQYNFKSVPQEFKKQYQNLIICEQQQRNGIKYKGEWKNDQKTIHGNGVLQSNTTKYIGQFKNGLKHFHGRQIQKYQVYQGMFQNGRRKGLGHKYTPQSKQQGYFNQYLQKGTIQYSNGNIYKGQLLNNLYHGKGQYYDAKTNIIYDGMYKYGKLDGHGQIKKIQQDNQFVIFNGYFKQGLKDGKGEFNWSHNNYYKGYYLKGKKHGYGELRNNNMQYTGQFKNGQIVNTNQIRYINQIDIFREKQTGLPQQWETKLRRQNQQSEVLPQPESAVSRDFQIKKTTSEQGDVQPHRQQLFQSGNNSQVNSIQSGNRLAPPMQEFEYQPQPQPQRLQKQKTKQQQKRPKQPKQPKQPNPQPQPQTQPQQPQLQPQPQPQLQQPQPQQQPQTQLPPQPQQQPQPQPKQYQYSQQNPIYQQKSQINPNTQHRMVTDLGISKNLSENKIPYVPNSDIYVPRDNNYQGVLINSQQSAELDPADITKNDVKQLSGYVIRQNQYNQIKKQKVDSNILPGTRTIKGDNQSIIISDPSRAFSIKKQLSESQIQRQGKTQTQLQSQNQLQSQSQISNLARQSQTQIQSPTIQQTRNSQNMNTNMNTNININTNGNKNIDQNFRLSQSQYLGQAQNVPYQNSNKNGFEKKKTLYKQQPMPQIQQPSIQIISDNSPVQTKPNNNNNKLSII